MKKILLFFIGCCGLIDISCAGEQSSLKRTKSSFWFLRYNSFIAAVTFQKQLRSLSPHSVDQVHKQETVLKSYKMHQPTKAVVYQQELSNSNHEKMKRSSSAVGLNTHEDCPTPDLGILIPSKSKDDLSLLVSVRSRTGSQDNFGFYVEVPDSPKSPKLMAKRVDSFESKQINRPLGFTHNNSSFGSTTSSYGELKEIESQKIKRSSSKIKPHKLCDVDDPSPFTPPTSPTSK